MGNRLSRIYTRTGDTGTTSLGDGTRVPKDHPRLAAFGDVDELNSQLGLIAAEPLPECISALLGTLQHDLFDLGAELVMPGHEALREARVTWLEDSMDAFQAELGPLEEFILPGGSRAAAQAHAARTVCRRAERTLHHAARRYGAFDFRHRPYVDGPSELKSAAETLGASMEAVDGYIQRLIHEKEELQQPSGRKEHRSPFIVRRRHSARSQCKPHRTGSAEPGGQCGEVLLFR